MSSVPRPSVPESRASVVLHTGGIYRGSENAVVEKALGSRPGVLAVEANPVAQTANVVFDPSRTNASELCRWIEECGYHCAGESVPEHVCPMEEAAEDEAGPRSHGAHAAPGEMVMA